MPKLNRPALACFVLLCAALAASARPDAAAGAEAQLGQVNVQAQPDQVNAQAQPGEGQLYTVTGTVVNSVTGEPVPRAMVQFFLEGQHTTLSGPDGHFSIEDVKPGMATVTAEKPGYFSAQQVNSGQLGQPYPYVNVGHDSTDVTVKLFPAGVITGHVTDASGEPVENLSVQALFRSVVDGRAHWEPRSTSFTDDTGAFRMGGLMPGAYVLVTGNKPVRLLAPYVRLDHENFDEVYAATFSGGGATLASAVPVQANPGQEAVADMTVTPEKAYRIDGYIAGGNARVAGVQVMDSDGQRLSLPAMVDRRTGTFRILGVPPGVYQLMATSMDGANVLNAVQDVSVGDADVTDVPLELNASVSIPVHVTVEEGDAPGAPASEVSESVEVNTTSVIGGRPVPVPPQVSPPMVRLIPQRASMVGANWAQMESVDGQQAITFKNVMPGRYRVSVAPNGPYYVAAARSGRTDLASDDLVVAGGAAPQPIEITLRGGGAILDCVVKHDDQPAMGFVLIAPDSPSAADLHLLVSGADGHFQVGGLAPGDYHVFAWPSNTGIEYAAPQFLKKYVDNAAQVSLTAGQKSTVTVELNDGGTGGGE